MSGLDPRASERLFREDTDGAAVHDQGEHMQRGAAETTRTAPAVADIQFAGKRRRKVDWRSRPAAELERTRATQAQAIEQRLERGLLLDGIR